MSKFVEASENISDLFENYRKECNIPMFVQFKYLHCPTQKVVLEQFIRNIIIYYQKLSTFA